MKSNQPEGQQNRAPIDYFRPSSMGKNKLKQFAELDTFSNAMQFGLHKKADFKLKGKWASEYFKNKHPIVLELACGKGEYAVGMARLHSDKNFIGIDIKGNRIWRGAKTALEEKLHHVAFLRTNIEWLTDFFADGEVSEIWITFSDPFLSSSKAHKRLSSTRFLDLYHQVLPSGGQVHLKTDDETLYQYTLDVLSGVEKNNKWEFDVNQFKLISARNDIYNDGGEVPDVLNIKTYYEKKHLAKGKKIKYVIFQKK